MPAFVTKKIDSRRSLGTLFKTARRRLELTLEQAEAETKIPLKYLSALEEGDYRSLPAEAYNIGYVRGYAQFLRLNPDNIVQAYRDERSQKWHQVSLQQSPFAPKKVSDWHFLVTPKLVAALGIIVVFGGVTAYIVRELRQFTQPPQLLISSVPTEFTTSKDQVTLAGHTTGGSLLSINSEPIFVASDGTFSQDVQLSPGINEITVQAKSRADKVSRQTVKVLYSQDLAKAQTTGIKE